MAPASGESTSARMVERVMASDQYESRTADPSGTMYPTKNAE